jgi:endonuclease III
MLSPAEWAGITVAFIMGLGGILTGLSAYAGRKTADERRLARETAEAQARNVEAQTAQIYANLTENELKQRQVIEGLLKDKSAEVKKCAEELSVLYRKIRELEAELFKIKGVQT